MAFEGLADKLGNAFKKLKKQRQAFLKKDVKEAMREVRLALLEADVNYKVAKDFTNKVTERAVGQDVIAKVLLLHRWLLRLLTRSLQALWAVRTHELSLRQSLRQSS